MRRSMRSVREHENFRGVAALNCREVSINPGGVEGGKLSAVQASG